MGAAAATSNSPATASATSVLPASRGRGKTTQVCHLRAQLNDFGAKVFYGRAELFELPTHPVDGRRQATEVLWVWGEDGWLPWLFRPRHFRSYPRVIQFWRPTQLLGEHSQKSCDLLFHDTGFRQEDVDLPPTDMVSVVQESCPEPTVQFVRKFDSDSAHTSS